MTAVAKNHIKMPALFPEIESYVETISIDQIGLDRRKKLDSLAEIIQKQLDQFKAVNLVFICTHNSRRSQFAQVWAKVLSIYFGLENIHCDSAGTESTALYSRVAKTLEKIGFQLENESILQNPRYSIKFSSKADEIELYSKTIDHIPPLTNGFIAVMVCSDAEENCPYIPDALVRFALPYKDPKRFDDTPNAAAEYGKTSREIATELYYILSKISLKAT